MKLCATDGCSVIFEPSNNRHKFCAECAKERIVNRNRKWKKDNPLKHRAHLYGWRKRSRDFYQLPPSAPLIFRSMAEVHERAEVL